jgi:hypothetical protein
MKEEWFVQNPLLEHHLKQLGKNRLVWVSLGVVLAGWLFAITRQPTSSKTPFLFLAEVLILWFLMPLIAKGIMEGSHDHLKSCRDTGQFVVGKLFPLLVVIIPLHFLCGILMWFLVLSSDFGSNFDGMMTWWTLSQSVVLTWSIMLAMLTVWLSFRWGNPSKAVSAVLIGQVVFLFASFTIFHVWLSVQGWDRRCVIPPFLVFLAHEYPWFQQWWMLFVPLVPALYNPVIVLWGVREIFGYPSVVRHPPQYWGSWQTFAYLVLTGIFVVLFANSVAKAMRKTL